MLHEKSICTKFACRMCLTRNIEGKGLKCNVCSKLFQSKSKLVEHYRKHTGEKPFACQICDKKFAHKCALVDHQTFHSDVRNFKCSICPESRSFKTKDQLSHHMVFHYEPKFVCSHCDYKAHTKSNLSQHEKSHRKKKN